MKVTGIDLALARKVLQTEADAIVALIDRLDERFETGVSSHARLPRRSPAPGQRLTFCTPPKPFTAIWASSGQTM